MDGKPSLEGDWNVLRGNHRKTAKLLELTVRRMVFLFGIERVGMLTLTFADHVTDAREAQRRLNSLLSNYVRPLFAGLYLTVMERCKSGRIHFHLLVVCSQDIRTGYDAEAVAAGDYRSASTWLRSLWADLRRNMPKYGFGRPSLEPVKSTEDAVAFYVSKYISKHIGQRVEADKGVRLLRISSELKAGTVKFSWHTVKFRLWREKVRAICEVVGIPEEESAKALGKNWAWKYQDIIQAVQPSHYWSEEAAAADNMPDGLTEPGKVLDWLQETGGKYRVTAAEAVGLIGNRACKPAFQRMALGSLPIKSRRIPILRVGASPAPAGRLESRTRREFGTREPVQSLLEWASGGV